MSNEKDWGNKPSMNGLGISQDLLGVPYDGGLTKGDLMLKNQARIAEAVEKMTEGTSTETIVQVVENNDTEALQKLTGQMEGAFEAMEEGWREASEGHLAAMGELTDLMEYQNTLGEYQLEVAEEQLDVQYDIRDGVDGVVRGVRTGNKILTAIGGIGIAQLMQTRALGQSIKQGFDQVDDRLSEILDIEEVNSEWLESIDDNLSALNHTAGRILQDGERRTQLIAGIIPLLKAKMVQDHLQHEDMKRHFVGLFSVVLRRIAGFRNDVRQGFSQLVTGQREMIARLDTPEKIRAGHYRKNGLEWLQTGKYSEAVSDLSEALKHNSRDFGARLGLARAFKLDSKREEYTKQLSLTFSMAKTREERSLLCDELLDEAGSGAETDIASVALLLRLFPEKFEDIMDFAAKNKRLNEVVSEHIKKPLSDTMEAFWCAARLAENGEKEKVEETLQNLSAHARCDLSAFAGKTSGKNMPDLRRYQDFLRSELSDKVNGNTALVIAANLIGNDGSDGLTVSFVKRAVTEPGDLRELLDAKDYDRAYNLLRTLLGESVGRLIRFRIVPQPLRSLIRQSK
jgi:hypothetical protein